jgi:RNA polymerase sigma factor (sigma-70 family)
VPFHIGGESVNVNEAYEAWRAAEGQAKNDALEALFKTVRRYVERLMYKLKGECPPDFADDVAEDAIIGLDRFKGESKFSSWVGAIVHNKWADYIDDKTKLRRLFEPRRRFDEGESEEKTWKSEAGDFEDVVDYERKIEKRLQLAEVESHISPGDRPLYEAVFVEGRTHREAAEVLHKGEAAVESRVRRMRSKLRGQLEKVA